MVLRDKITGDAGLQYVVEATGVISAAGRRALLDTPLMTKSEDIEEELERVARVKEKMEVISNLRTFNEIRHSLMCLHDSQGTLANLERRTVIDELELYEMKNLAYATMEVTRHGKSLGLEKEFELPEVSDVFELLDPDHTGLPNFYIYDTYHEELPELRKTMKALQARGDDPVAQQEYGRCFDRHSEIQHEVENRLSEQLWGSAERLKLAMATLCHIDILIAKAELASDWGLTKPTMVTEGATRYEELFNPRLKHRNEEQRLRYQPVTIDVREGLCLVTGANMAGKTVLLKTLATAQALAQFAYFVPAKKAEVRVMEDIVLCIGDEQNEMNGLSSFASEIINISETVKRSEKERLLILIDEPARTTNPVEGKAIVQSLGDILSRRESFSIITTHYSELGTDCRRLRIAGFREDMANVPISPRNINQFMDYSVVEDSSETVPHEALRIATLLGCDGNLLELAEEHIKETL